MVQNAFPGATETTPALAGLRVAVVNWRDPQHSQAGGAEHYAWHFARALREAGADVEFVTARDRHQDASSTVDGIHVRRRGGRIGFYAHAAWYYLSRRRRLDLVIDPECGIPTFAPLFLPRSTPVVLVVHHIHQDQFGLYFPRPVAALGRWLERVAMRRVYRNARVVAVSESTEDLMRSRLGWRGPIGILPNGTAQPRESADDHPADSDQEERIVVLGRLVAHKRVDAVIEAMGGVRATRPSARLHICGRGPEEARLRRLVETRGLGDSVTFHGYLPDAEKDELLRTARLHVCASDHEGWGQVVVEAAAHRVPTVARDVPGLRDSVLAGRTGWLLEAERAEPLPDSLARLIDIALGQLENESERERWARACREWAGRFTWEAMHAHAIEIACEAVAEKRSTMCRAT